MMIIITQRKVILFLLFFLICLTPKANAENHNDEFGRLIISLNDNWRFHKGPQGDKENWKVVHLPHTWNAKDGTDGGNNYYRGDSWYQKEINIPKNYQGKSLYLQLAAANKEAEVFINGKSTITHKGGYTAFTVEITDDVNYGKMNLITIRVNNETKDIIPLSGDFTFYGGLYRGINLLVTDPTHIDVQDDGSKGVYVSIPNSKSIKNNAQVSIKVPVKSEDQKVMVKASISDGQGKRVASTKLTADEKKSELRGKAIFTGTISVRGPHLWNGMKDPYLYTVTATVIRKGQVIDQVKEKIGFRYYTIDPKKGFFLNGNSYPLHGVAINQDRAGFGNAIPDKIRAKDFELIKEIGANTIRTAHYPQSQFVYEKADEMGLIVWTEIPFVNEMRTTTEFAENTKRQLTEMIKQNNHHPSIVTWGLQNELGAFGGYIPGSAIPKDVQYQQVTKLLQDLADTAMKLDPERFVSQAIMGVPATEGIPLTPKMEEQLDWGANTAAGGGKNKIAKFIELSSLNFYFGWYTPQISDLETAITSLHKKYPDAKLGISEYGAGANPSQHQLIEQRFKWDGKKAIGQWHPEEYQSVFHERSYGILTKHPELWTTYVWAMFDFGSDWRNEGNNPGINDKGLITFDRKLKKDAFYFYKAQWNKTEPFVYITSRRYMNRKERISPIKVYSNVNKVTLTVNGKNYGQGKLQQPGVFIWNHVELKNSGNVVVAAAKSADGTNVKDHVLNWIVK
ncbi:MAG: glycoside hydrolase family 2 TIM barrel-domain containing protein [Bacillota bacterium]|nr:glycoside hydrolase family 2 TIM barrel-domain containing protein [Bacillota bacterium]